MGGYVLMDVEITDQGAFDAVVERAPEIVGEHGGKFLVRGGATEVLQGDWTPHRLVIVAFDSVEQAKAWWNSPGHTELRSMFDRCSRTTATVAEGV